MEKDTQLSKEEMVTALLGVANSLDLDSVENLRRAEHIIELINKVIRLLDVQERDHRGDISL